MRSVIRVTGLPRRWAAALAVVSSVSLLTPAGTAHAAPVNGPGRRAVAQGLMADYDGDGRSDYVELTEPECVPPDGDHDSYTPWIWNVQESGSGHSYQVALGNCNTDLPVVGDFNGDGRTDFAYVRRNDPAPGLLSWHIQYSSGGGETVPWGANSLGDVPVAGDFDGDGRTDFAVVRPNDPKPGLYTWVVRFAKGGPAAHVQWGANNLADVPVAGDFDGDGKTDFAVVRPTSGGHWTWAIDYSGGGQHHEVWGASATDVPISGDYNDDGRTDYTVVREPWGDDVSGQYTWYVDCGNGQTASLVWGEVQDSGAQVLDTPVSGDFGGDGASDFAVLRQGDSDQPLWAIAIAGSTTDIRHHVGYFPEEQAFPQGDDGWVAYPSDS